MSKVMKLQSTFNDIGFNKAEAPTMRIHVKNYLFTEEKVFQISPVSEVGFYAYDEDLFRSIVDPDMRQALYINSFPPIGLGNVFGFKALESEKVFKGPTYNAWFDLENDRPNDALIIGIYEALINNTIHLLIDDLCNWNRTPVDINFDHTNVLYDSYAADSSNQLAILSFCWMARKMGMGYITTDAEERYYSFASANIIGPKCGK